MIAALGALMLIVGTLGSYGLLALGHFQDMDPAEYRRVPVPRTPADIPLALPDIEGLI